MDGVYVGPVCFDVLGDRVELPLPNLAIRQHSLHIGRPQSNVEQWSSQIQVLLGQIITPSAHRPFFVHEYLGLQYFNLNGLPLDATVRSVSESRNSNGAGRLVNPAFVHTYSLPLMNFIPT